MLARTNKTPSWWYGSNASLMPVLLEPAALLWRLGTWFRWSFANPYVSKLPVACIGNLTAGGAGKTPTAIAVAQLLKEAGEQPVFLTRGYGGSASAPLIVDRSSHAADDVGDESLLLSEHAPTVVSPDRVEGAKLCETLDASVIVMDDGFQNPSLAKDFSLVVVDQRLGAGNGLIVPAGPLRAPIARQLALADAAILIGDGAAADDIAVRMHGLDKPVLYGHVVPSGSTDWLSGTSVHAFAGIAHPEKFFLTLEQAGARMAGKTVFGDHHKFSESDATRLLATATQDKCELVTTAKDHVRIPAHGEAFAKLRKAARVLPVRLDVQESEALASLLLKAIKRKSGRS